MITYREMKESDYPVLVDFIWRKWGSSELKKNPENALYYGYMILYFELAESSAAFVPDEDGKPVGLLILSIRDGHSIDYKMFKRMMDAGAKLSETEAGAKAMRDWLDLEVQYSGVGGPIVEKEGLDAEILLFINDEEHRGKGIGSGMFTYAAKYLHDQGCKTFYLQSEECSDHDYYPTVRNMRELSRRKSHVDIGDVKDTDLFIYCDTVENQMNM